MARDSKGGWLLYIMVHVPLICFFKVGITAVSIGAKKRASAIDRAVVGFPFPIAVVVIPGAYHVEQALHQMMRRFNVRFYKGDGASEWFLLAPLFVALPIFLAIWAIYIAAFDAATGTKFLPIIASAIVDFAFEVWGVGCFLNNQNQ